MKPIWSKLLRMILDNLFWPKNWNVGLRAMKLSNFSCIDLKNTKKPWKKVKCLSVTWSKTLFYYEIFFIKDIFVFFFKIRLAIVTTPTDVIPSQFSIINHKYLHSIMKKCLPYIKNIKNYNFRYSTFIPERYTWKIW